MAALALHLLKPLGGESGRALMPSKNLKQNLVLHWGAGHSCFKMCAGNSHGSISK